MQLESPFELHIRNVTSHRVQNLKNSIIADLWALAHELQSPNGADSATAALNLATTRNQSDVAQLAAFAAETSAFKAFREWSNVANTGYVSDARVVSYIFDKYLMHILV